MSAGRGAVGRWSLAAAALGIVFLGEPGRGVGLPVDAPPPPTSDDDLDPARAALSRLRAAPWRPSPVRVDREAGALVVARLASPPPGPPPSRAAVRELVHALAEEDAVTALHAFVEARLASANVTPWRAAAAHAAVTEEARVAGRRSLPWGSALVEARVPLESLALELLPGDAVQGAREPSE